MKITCASVDKVGPARRDYLCCAIKRAGRIDGGNVKTALTEDDGVNIEMAHRFISANRHRVKTEHIKNLFSAAAHRRGEP